MAGQCMASCHFLHGLFVYFVSLASPYFRSSSLGLYLNQAQSSICVPGYNFAALAGNLDWWPSFFASGVFAGLTRVD